MIKILSKQQFNSIEAAISNYIPILRPRLTYKLLSIKNTDFKRYTTNSKSASLFSKKHIRSLIQTVSIIKTVTHFLNVSHKSVLLILCK